jgi:hypothetical protein
VLTTRNYEPTPLLNLRGHESVVRATFRALPADERDLRARLLRTLAGNAADRRDPELQQQCLDLVRATLFDRNELPQMRVLALNLLTRKWLTIDDALRLKNMRRDEQPGLRALFGDFLIEYF